MKKGSIRVILGLLLTLLIGIPATYGESKVTDSTIKNKLGNIVKRLKDPQKELSPQDWAKLKKGEIIIKQYIYTTKDGKQAGMAKGIILVNLPPDAIWNVITDYEHYNEFMPTVKKTKILKRLPNDGVRLYHKIKIVFVTLEYVCDIIPVKYPDGSRILQWKLAKGPGIKNDIKDTTGFWEVIPIDNGKKTLLTYTAFVDTGWAVPGWVQNYLTKKQLPKILRNTVEEAEKRLKK